MFSCIYLSLSISYFITSLNRSEEDIKKLETQLAEAPKPEDLAR